MIFGIRANVRVTEETHSGCATCPSQERNIDLAERYHIDMTPCWVCNDCAASIERLHRAPYIKERDHPRGEFLDLLMEDMLA